MALHTQKMSTGGSGISLNQDSVTTEFQSRIVLGKMKINTCIYISTGG